eukprot:SAG22_NODE_7009_length_786_cov_0.903930_2_plen_126_part_01
MNTCACAFLQAGLTLYIFIELPYRIGFAAQHQEAEAALRGGWHGWDEEDASDVVVDVLLLLDFIRSWFTAYRHHDYFGNVILDCRLAGIAREVRSKARPFCCASTDFHLRQRLSVGLSGSAVRPER